jgi:hypothetical protein
MKKKEFQTLNPNLKTLNSKSNFPILYLIQHQRTTKRKKDPVDRDGQHSYAWIILIR